MTERDTTILPRRPIVAWICFLMAITSFGFTPQGKDEIELRRTLKQMDVAGKTFKSFVARFSQKKYTAVLKEFDTPETGEFYYTRAKDGSALVRQDTTSPGRRILTVKGDEAINYQPEIKQAQIVNLGNHKNIAEYLAIGIGQSPEKLEKDFYLSHQGSESINGEPCSILQLKPKSPKVASYFSLITLWVKKSNGILLQNKFSEPSGNYTLVTFSDEKLNVKIPDSKFEQKLPKDVDKQNI
jgi:outer membrane lipoprotein-sorting protein